jgi:2-amino-4-hydroxy-6-hydroxymethyldihydropteridine diphosphokinase
MANSGSRRRVRAYVGLGANLGEPDLTLVSAVHALAELPGARLVGVSRLYATEPWGPIEQPEFRNAVAALDVPVGPTAATGAMAFLVALKAIERAFGRRERERWGPRELDLDLLVFGRALLSIEPPGGGPDRSAGSGGPAGDMDASLPLVVPHPLAPERLFVLAPLADLAPGLIPPGWRMTVRTARDRRAGEEGATAVRPVAGWDRAAGAWIPLER